MRGTRAMSARNRFPYLTSRKPVLMAAKTLGGSKPGSPGVKSGSGQGEGK
jgi:hypothetical protein